VTVLASILAAVGALTLALFSAAVGSWLERRREHFQWLRNARVEAHSAYRTAIRQMISIGTRIDTGHAL
jgi:uncharacterized iron-regulated membrane protein